MTSFYSPLGVLADDAKSGPNSINLQTLTLTLTIIFG
jgi:hypothetical protein